MASPIEINPQFARVLELLEDPRQSLFITGKAGTGKSTLLEYFSKKAISKPVILAPTGVAALNVKGQTIHSFFNFYIDVTPEKITKRETKPRNPKIYKSLKTIIIDEISMVRADLLDCIDCFLRIYGPIPSVAFGGVQMILVGDLYQLPPVVNAQEQEIFSTHYASPYFFSAKAFQGFPIEVVELEKIYRQKDENFVGLLNRIRNNSVESQDINLLNSRFVANFAPQKNDFYINLTTTNKRANAINDSHLSILEGKTYNYSATISGEFGEEYFPTAINLSFKIGSQVMLLNNDPKKRWVNGTIGIIESVGRIDGEEQVVLRLAESGREVFVQRFQWEVFRFFVENNGIKADPVGNFTQFPFRLAWAVTIHKSQGKTFDRVVLDIGQGTFAAGQLYVGLSRCTSFEGVVLSTPIRKHHIHSDPRIYKFLTSYQYRKANLDLPSETRVKLLREAIDEGGNLMMTYLSAKDSKSEDLIRPIRVGTANYRGKSFLALQAFCLAEKQERMFHVGRILALRKIS